MPDRRFPAPWSVDEENAACFLVRDRDGYQHAPTKYPQQHCNPAKSKWQASPADQRASME
jgi:hypothetical protein